MNKACMLLTFLMGGNFLYGSQNAQRNIADAILAFPTPLEVAHELDIKPQTQGVYQLDEARIAQLKKKFESNFTMRSRLSKLTYIATAGSLAWLAYKWGCFDYFLPAKKATEVSLVPEVTDPAKTFDYLVKLVAYLKTNETALKERIEVLETKNDVQHGNIVVRVIKYVGWSGISIIGSLVVHYKWQRFFDYVLAQPSFSWFFSHHSILQTIEGLKRNVKVLTEHKVPTQYSMIYHAEATVPAIESLVRNLEELIAFTEYYLETLDQTMVYEQKMDSIARYLFNASNDFFKNIAPIIQDPSTAQAPIAVIDDFKADLNAWINRCTLFEREFINE